VVAVAVKVRKVLKAQSVPQVRKGLLAVQEQMVKRERLDLRVLQEAQEQLVQLAQQEIKEMWEQLDQLVPLDPQD
jgi:regulator of sirC expression with transglutaminase-like and TPR domain